MSGLLSPKTLVLFVVVVSVLLSVSADSVPVTQQNLVPRQRAAPQLRFSPTYGLCPPGYHISEDGRDCISCQNGQDYTTHWNHLLFCFRCTKCDSGKVEIRSCTTVTDTVCQCKEGTFQEEDSPEICRKCSTGCPSGMVPLSNCMPWSDIKCVHKKSGIIIGIIVAVVFLVVAAFIWKTSLWKKILPYLKGIGSGRGRNLEPVDRSSHARGGPGTEDNIRNEFVSILQPIQDPEQEVEVQEPAVAGDNVLPPGEPEHLLEPAEAEGSRRRLLVPANGADPTETLRQCFHHFTDNVPFKSWVPFVRELGLTGNEIDVARAEAAGPGDTLYEMLRKWVNKMGRDASVHTLLDALETLEQRLAKQKIQDCLVSSGKFVYLEDNADSAIS
ncbi:tumor necrosis factor receptor superfamily member 10B isoform X2 [Aotus nancymaae]|uniref:TNF receptor superfamily member 10b n=1 Tax=Aotus nancymaae TaxID=37293 RepID=A0A2K5E643_AOTNA|nr:tumor necrosis factor receptor superfamily member 10B isoform X2 [Aotus nancymaae]